MELERKDTKMIQGLSVLAMLYLHLFDRDHTGLFTPLIFVGKVPLSFCLGQLSDFCVFGFAFCSGYAHMCLYRNPDYFSKRLKSLYLLLINYWVVILFFSVISIITGSGKFMPGNFRTILGNIFLFDITYNGAWWYMYAYVVIVLMSPVLLKFVKKQSSTIVLGVGFVIYCLAYYVRFHVDVSGLWLSKLGPLGMTIFEYLVGCVFYKEQIVAKLYNYWKRLSLHLRITFCIVAFAGILLGRTFIVPSLFVAPVTGIVILLLFHYWRKPKAIEQFFLFMGKHATNIWLTHMFFYSVLFKNYVYIAKYPIFIYIVMLLVTLGVSCLLQMLERPIIKCLI